MQDLGNSQRVRNPQCKTPVLACRRGTSGLGHPGCSLGAVLGLPLQKASAVMGFQEKMVHCFCSNCGALGEVSLKSADFGLNLYLFVFLGKSC